MRRAWVLPSSEPAKRGQSARGVFREAVPAALRKERRPGAASESPWPGSLERLWCVAPFSCARRSFMALISCPECERQVSDRAQACPQCGYPLSSTAERGSTNAGGMALTNCPECKREVSDRAAVCPHCGFPISSTAERQATNAGTRNRQAGLLEDVETGVDAGMDWMSRATATFLGTLLAIIVFVVLSCFCLQQFLISLGKH